MTRLLMINYGGHRCATLLIELSSRHVIRAIHSFMPGKWVDHRSQEGLVMQQVKERARVRGERLGRLLGP